MAKREETPLETAKKHHKEWLKAEMELTTAQSYTIGTRTLTRANLAEIRKQIEFWENKIEQLKNKEKRNGRNRIMRVVPRDL